MDIVLTEKIDSSSLQNLSPEKIDLKIPLTADDRTRSRQRLELENSLIVFLQLPRGTVLQDGDVLRSTTGQHLAQITAKPEPVLTVTTSDPLKLLQAAYHLGNRHVPLEITSAYLRLTFDPVLAHLLEHLGVEAKQEMLPFQPEAGAYGDHSNSHGSHHHQAHA